VNAVPSPGRPWLLGLPARGEGDPQGPSPGTDSLPHDATGLALSGGGIRSAAFCLGVIQALARAGWLRHVDYLSTVSGGGYIGAFLGRSFDAYRGGRTEPDHTPGAVQGRVARGLTDPGSESVDWLRRHSNYLAPGGKGDAGVNVAGFLRNSLSVYLVLGLFFLAVFGALNAVAYYVPSGPVATILRGLIAGASPLAGQLPAEWKAPWLVMAEAVLWLAVVPLMVAYWLVSQELSEAFVAPVLIAGALIAGGLTFMSGGPLPLEVLTASVLWAMASWAAVRSEEGPAGPTHPFRLALAGEHLTRRLAFFLTVAAALATLGALDAVGRWLARLMLDGGLTPRNIAAWLGSLASTVLGAAALLRMAALSFASRSATAATVERTGKRVLWSTAAFLLGAAPPLIALSFVSHATYEVGEAYSQGLAVTAAAAVASLLFGYRGCVSFINRSGPSGIYAGRLGRTFLGAVNPVRRRHPEGGDVTRPVAGDDVPLANYRPEKAGGPLHLINCAVNETVDVSSYRAVRDRLAENLAVGPAGMSVARDWHALWTADPDVDPPALAPIGEERPNPFSGRPGAEALAEPLGLQQWVAISGAAVGPGMGSRTGFKRSLLATLANARLGYWWDSGLEAGERIDTPVRRGPWDGLWRSFARLFQAQRLLFSELTGRFPGPWERYWNLSDGGNFEVTGAYELLRRRLPFVIICDAGEDPGHLGLDLARLARIARLDLGAEVAEFAPGPDALAKLGVPVVAAERIGALDDLLTPPGGPSRKHAALLRVRYPAPPPGADADPWLGRRQTWALFIKATTTGDEPADVLGYAASRPDFPNESTLDQAFDEPQWESYRRLGEHIGESLFIPLASQPHA